MFLKSFVQESTEAQIIDARKMYIDQIYEDIMQEIKMYKDVQDKSLAKVKINEAIWNQSME